MTHFTEIWRFNTARFAVILDCCDEDMPDLSWADDETNEKVASGEYVNVMFRVRVLCDGREVGADYLGNSVYADVRDFYHEHLGIRAKARADRCNYGCYFTDMVDRAVSEARETLSAMPRLRAAC